MGRVPRHTGGSVALPSAWQEPLSWLGAFGGMHSYVQLCPYLTVVPVTALSWSIFPPMGGLGRGQFTAAGQKTHYNLRHDKKKKNHNLTRSTAVSQLWDLHSVIIFQQIAVKNNCLFLLSLAEINSDSGERRALLGPATRGPVGQFWVRSTSFFQNLSLYMDCFSLYVAKGYYRV